MTDQLVLEQDFGSWNALFMVLSSAEAEPAIRALVPGLPVGAASRSIARNYLKMVKVASTNEAAHQVLRNAVAALGTTVGEDGFLSCDYARRLFQPNVTDEEAGLGIWARVLRSWMDDPSAPGAVRELLEDLTPTLSVAFTPGPTLEEDPEWTFLVEFAVERIVAGHVRDFLVSSSPAMQQEVFEQVIVAAVELGIPREVVEVVAFGDLAPNRTRAN